MVEKTRQMGVPVIMVDDQPVIGFDKVRLEALLSAGGGQKRPQFGLKIADASGAVSGAYIGGVSAVGVGARAGLKVGDIITDINDRKVGSAAEAEKVLTGLRAGNIVAIKFRRDTESHQAEIVL